MEENNPSRGRARGRSRGSLPVQVEPGVIDPGAQRDPSSGSSPEHEEPMEVEVGEGQEQDYSVMYGSEGSPGSGEGNNGSSSNGANGNGGNGHPSPNGNGGNGHRSPNGKGSPNGGTGREISRGFRTEQPDFVITRPEGFVKQGSFGQARRLVANFFELQMKKSMTLRMHLVTFDPEVDDVKIRKGLVNQRKELLSPYLFDGTQLFTTRQLEVDNLIHQIAFPDKPNEIYTVKIRYTRDCSTTEPIAFQLYNLIIKKCQDLLELDLIGRYYYDHEQTVKIPTHKLEMWPGFITSMRQQETNVLLKVDITFKVLRTDDVFSIMKEIRTRNPQDYRRICHDAIVGTIVMTRYNRKTYKIDDIDWNQNPNSKFIRTVKKVDQEISFLQYYEQRYQTRIQSTGQPMLISYPKEKDIRRGDVGNISLIPELCYQTGLNEEMRGNFRLMKDIANNLHMSPPQRLMQIKRFISRIRECPKATTELANWGVRFKADPVEVQGRQLPMEAIQFNSKTAMPNEQADWSQAFRNQRMLTTVPLKNWIMVVPSRDAGNTGNLISTMQRVATPLGYQIGQPDVIRVNDGQARTLQQAVHDAMAKRKGKLDLAFIILPTNKLDTYAAVKKTCSIDYGLPSQCFLSKNVTNKGLMSICTKLVIQMNAKQGGEPWSVANPLKGIMIVGFDVYHGGGTSIGAMTATMSPTLATYYSTITRQEQGLEMSATFGAALERCLKAYAQNNDGELPTRIMVYRDGVGEGQLMIINRSEVTHSKAVMKSLYSDLGQNLPRFTFIVVTKRTNTRLFELRGERGDCSNPGPGMVVDDVITCPEKYDFFLVPQSVRQGTVSPVAFNVLVDESGLDADKIQRFTFKLCHMYFNWSGTVPVPAPCQYAHKLAFLTGTALQNEVNERLSCLLHFL